MEIASFLSHFIYIAGTFIGGIALGYFGYEKINFVVNKLFRRK